MPVQQAASCTGQDAASWLSGGFALGVVLTVLVTVVGVLLATRALAETVAAERELQRPDDRDM